MVLVLFSKAEQNGRVFSSGLCQPPRDGGASPGLPVLMPSQIIWWKPEYPRTTDEGFKLGGWLCAQAEAF